MKNKIVIILFLLCCGLSLFSQRVQNENTHLDKTLSPYFHIETEGIDLDHFPLLSTKADVNITGPIADVTVTQVYKNDGNETIEAIYVFPASTRAAVYEMTMTVGERIIKADIQEKKQARKTYEKAKSEGKRASLLEQHRPNVFQMNVANILPGDEIKVEMKYNEFIIPENKIYSFVYPTVVGPRFGGPNADETAKFIKNPYTSEGTKPSYHFDINVALNAGMPIKESISPTHKVDINYTSKTTADIQLQKSESDGGNRDFIFTYSMSGNQIAEGTFLFDDGKEKFFLTTLEPPATTRTSEIPPREYIFVMDVSGSMRGFPIDVSKNLMKDLIGNLRPSDKFNIMLFAGGSQMMSRLSIAATQKNLKEAFQFIDTPQGGGGTRLLPALEKALDLKQDEEVYSRSIVVVTDGYVSVERAAFKLIANNLDKSNLFAFGIGSSVNRHLIEGMAHAGRGEAFIVTDKSQSQKTAKRFRKYIETPVLTNIDVSFDGFDTYDIIPFSFPDLLAERPLYVFGKYKGKAKGNINIKGKQGNKDYSKSIPVSNALVSNDNSPIKYLWAREKIRWLDDLNTMSTSKDDVEEITALGIQYNLLTKYTSFVAVDESPVMQDFARANGKPHSGKSHTVKQVLPLPAGVSNHAVGFELKVEGVVKEGEALLEEQLFVHISGLANEQFKTILQKTLQTRVNFTDDEQKMLSGNTLEILFDEQSKQWIIKDAKNKINTEFISQLTDLLKTICSSKEPKSMHIKINLLWV